MPALGGAACPFMFGHCPHPSNRGAEGFTHRPDAGHGRQTGGEAHLLQVIFHSTFARKHWTYVPLPNLRRVASPVLGGIRALKIIKTNNA
jgi:hypothetical protein